MPVMLFDLVDHFRDTSIPTNAATTGGAAFGNEIPLNNPASKRGKRKHNLFLGRPSPL
jgi:hypothetical protein